MEMPDSAAIWPTFHKRRDAADVVDVGLNDIDHAHFDQFAAAVVRNQPLARGDRRCRALRDARHRRDVLRRTRLLDEQQVQRLDFLHDDRRDARTRLRMEIDADIDVRPEPFAQQLHALNGAVDLLRASRSTRNSPGCRT